MKGLGNVKVSVKLTAGFLVVSAIAAVIGIKGIVSMKTMNDLAAAMYDRQVLGLGYTKEANVDLFDIEDAEKNIILAQSQEERDRFKQEYDGLLKALDENLAKAEELTESEEGKKIMGQLVPALKDWKAASGRVVETAFSEPLNSARQSTQLSMGDAAAKLKAASDAFEALSALKEKNAQLEDERTAAIYQSSLLVMIGLVAAGVLIGITIGLVLTSGITRQLGTEPNVMMEIAQRISQGDLTLKLNGKNGRKATGAYSALSEMKEKLTLMVTSIQENAQQVAASSEQISASSQKLAEGAQSQASTLEETSASVEELTASVDQVSGHAQSQASAVEEGTASMAQVQKSMEEVSADLAEIAGLAGASVNNAVGGATAVQQVVEGINLIAASSEKIAGIVGVISDIADQTNLLALNASIEAARAGEHGRGFAVVADEVSKLADRSSASTKEIETLIRDSVRSVAKGVETAAESQKAMEQIRSASEKVKEMISGLSGSMTEQVGAVRELSKALENLSEMSQSISAATEEQTTNAKQVSAAVENVNDITQGAASAAEEMSSATEQLSGMAQELQRLAAQFQIEEKAGREAQSAIGGAHAGNGKGTGNGRGKGRNAVERLAATAAG